MSAGPDINVYRRPPWEVICWSCDTTFEAWTQREALRLRAEHRRKKASECAAFAVCRECGHPAIDHAQVGQGCAHSCKGGGYDHEQGLYPCECENDIADAMMAGVS